ncbi:hypothetical protein J3R30DRAFT_3702144 [Lentinula aciculospora]|uniref:Uncharacterized protein n=1 Tax=Lentinula aciculospora TaxID=153920 RepID=A0A9W9DNY2_9AGAR|nr:hypothetical protein J3R30DRAFT_3702144 [Lentinula aciculospora]
MKLRAFKRIAKLLRRPRRVIPPYIPPASHSTSLTSYTTSHSELGDTNVQNNRSDDGPDEGPISTHAINSSITRGAQTRPPVHDHVYLHPDSAHQYHRVPAPTRTVVPPHQRSDVHIGGHVIFPVSSIDYLLRIEEVIPSPGHKCPILPVGEIKIVSSNENVLLERGRRIVLLIGSPTGEGNEYVAKVMKHYAVTSLEDDTGVRERRRAESVRFLDTLFSARADAITEVSLKTTPLQDQQSSQLQLGDSSSTAHPATAITSQRVNKGKAKRREEVDIGSSSSGFPLAHAPSSFITEQPLVNDPERLRNAQQLRENLMRELSIQPPQPSQTNSSRETPKDTLTEHRPQNQPGIVHHAHPPSQHVAAPSGNNTSFPLFPPGLPRHPLPPQMEATQRAVPINVPSSVEPTSPAGDTIPPWNQARIEDFKRESKVPDSTGHRSHQTLHDSPSVSGYATTVLDARNDPDMRSSERAANWLRNLPDNSHSFEDAFTTRVAHHPTGETARVPEQWQNPAIHMAQIREDGTEHESRSLSAYVTALTPHEGDSPYNIPTAVHRPVTLQGHDEYEALHRGPANINYYTPSVTQQQPHDSRYLVPGQPLQVGHFLEDGESAYTTAVSHDFFNNEQGRLSNRAPPPVQKPRTPQEHLAAHQFGYHDAPNLYDFGQTTPTPRAPYGHEHPQSSFAVEPMSQAPSQSIQGHDNDHVRLPSFNFEHIPPRPNVGEVDNPPNSYQNVPTAWGRSTEHSDPSALVPVWPPQRQGPSNPYQRPPVTFEVPARPDSPPMHHDNYWGPFHDAPLPSVSPGSQVFPMFASGSTDAPDSVDPPRSANPPRPINPSTVSPELPVVHPSSPGFPSLPSPFGHRDDMDVVTPSLSPLYHMHKSSAEQREVKVSFGDGVKLAHELTAGTIPVNVPSDAPSGNNMQGEPSGQSASTSSSSAYPYFLLPGQLVDSPEELTTADIMFAQRMEQENQKRLEFNNSINSQNNEGTLKNSCSSVE